MSWPGFTSLGAGWLLLLAVPLVALYFLKLKRPQVRVPSLVLWQQVISDQRVNSPFQRFRRNLLLWLQLLLLLALVLGAMQPFIPSTETRLKNLPVLIDCSASMGSVDVAGGGNRLDEAKQRVKKLIEQLLPDQRMAIVEVTNTARRLTDFTDNKRDLLAKLESLQVRDVPSKLDDGLRMAQAMARTARIERVLFVSDGNVPPQIDFELPYRLSFDQIVTKGNNLGITEFNARRNGSRWNVFVRIDGSESASGLCDVLLTDGPEIIGRKTVTISPGVSERIEFEIDGTRPASLEATLVRQEPDSLAVDNTARLELAQQRPLVVYCPSALATYRQVLAILPTLVIVPTAGALPPEVAELKTYDLAIVSGDDEPPRPAKVTLHVGSVPAELKSSIEVASGVAEVADWSRVAGLLQHVQLLDVAISENPQYIGEASEKTVEEAGYTVWATTAKGPLVLARERDDQYDYRLLFHTDRSTLPYRVGFPILVANLVQAAWQQSGLEELRALGTGVLPAMTGTPDERYQLIGEEGSQEATAEADGRVAGFAVYRSGNYRLVSGTGDERKLGVSLLNLQETSLKSTSELGFQEVNIAADDKQLPADFPLWTYLVVVALGVMLVEWWFFNRPPAQVI